MLLLVCLLQFLNLEYSLFKHLLNSITSVCIITSMGNWFYFLYNDAFLCNCKGYQITCLFKTYNWLEGLY